MNATVPIVLQDSSKSNLDEIAVHTSAGPENSAGPSMKSPPIVRFL